MQYLQVKAELNLLVFYLSLRVVTLERYLFLASSMSASGSIYIFVLWSIITSLSFDRSGDLIIFCFFSNIVIGFSIKNPVYAGTKTANDDFKKTTQVL